jgi:enamine deaminase RidA (YjgF/YER057c/UK114 family)
LDLVHLTGLSSRGGNRSIVANGVATMVYASAVDTRWYAYAPAFAPFIRSGDQIHLSGRLGNAGAKRVCGKVDKGISLEQRHAAARGVAIELLAVLKGAVGDLDNVPQILRLFVMVNGAPNFTEPYRVADGASELLVQVFGERSIHARSAASVAQVPFGACVEIAMIAELRATKIGGSI